MKKNLALLCFFLTLVTPVFAKGSTETQTVQMKVVQVSQDKEGGSQTATTIIPSKRMTDSPTRNKVNNQNEVKIENNGEEEKLSVKTQETEQLNQDVTQSFTKVSDQVRLLIETTGAKGGIGQEVKIIAQSQTRLQDEIKTDFENLNSRGALTRLIIGSDKKLTRVLEQKMEQNRIMVQQLEQLKLQTKNADDLQQLQETIDLMTYQSNSLQDKIERERKVNGLFGWLTNLFVK